MANKFLGEAGVDVLVEEIKKCSNSKTLLPIELTYTGDDTNPFTPSIMPTELFEKYDTSKILIKGLDTRGRTGDKYKCTIYIKETDNGMRCAIAYDWGDVDGLDDAANRVVIKTYNNRGYHYITGGTGNNMGDYGEYSLLQLCFDPSMFGSAAEWAARWQGYPVNSVSEISADEVTNKFNS